MSSTRDIDLETNLLEVFYSIREIRKTDDYFNLTLDKNRFITKFFNFGKFISGYF